MKFTSLCRHHGLHPIGLASLLLVLFACSHPVMAPKTPRSYDRTWWNATDTEQRAEFLAGYDDCALYDLGQTDLANAQWGVLEPEITRYYSTHEDAAETVPALFVRFGSGRPPSTDPAPEVYSGPHGFFDGDYWWQLSEPQRTGFVQGYLACYESGSRGHGLHDHPVEWYVDKVSSFYCFTGKTCADEHVSEDQRIPEKIAFILQRLEGQ